MHKEKSIDRSIATCKVSENVLICLNNKTIPGTVTGSGFTT